MVEENCELNENCSSEASFSINPATTIDVPTTSPVSPELLQLERFNNVNSGDGVLTTVKGVC